MAPGSRVLTRGKGKYGHVVNNTKSKRKKPNNCTFLYSYMNLIGNYLQYYDFYETPYLIREIVGPSVKD